MRVHYCLFIIGSPHTGSAHRVKDRGADVARQLRQLVVGLVLKAGFEFLRLVLHERRLLGNTTRHSQRVCRNFPVFRRAQVIGGYRRCLFWIVAADAHRTPAGGVQIADAGGDGREIVKRLPEGVQAKGLHMVFDVGVIVFLGTAGKQTQL